MKILVTGGRGQLGQALQTLKTTDTIQAFDHSALDITDRDKVRRIIQAEKPNAVINAAAYNNVDKAESEPDVALAVNAQGPENLAIVTAECGLPFIHLSTDYVFDGTKRVPYTEMDDVRPLSAYGRSKWEGEQAVRRANPKHFIVRTAWVFHTRGENFFTKLLALSKKGPLRIVDNQFSSPTYAPHLAEGLLKLLPSACYGTYHMTGQGGASRFEEFQMFLKLTRLPIKISPVSSEEFKQTAVRPQYTVMTTVQVPRILLPAWEQGVEEFVKEFNP